MFLMCINVSVYALVAYGFMPLGKLVVPDMQEVFERHSFGIYTHVFASIVALAFGPLQFSPKLRRKNLNIHRWLGRTYLFVGVLLGGLSGLYMAQLAFGGVVAKIGFTGSAIAWLFTGFMAYQTIRARDIDAHRRWMVRNFSLTFSAVTLRIYLGIFMAAGMRFDEFYPVLAWISWVPNIIVAEWLFNRRSSVVQTA